jgi:hypothetical protein
MNRAPSTPSTNIRQSNDRYNEIRIGTGRAEKNLLSNDEGDGQKKRRVPEHPPFPRLLLELQPDASASLERRLEVPQIRLSEVGIRKLEALVDLLVHEGLAFAVRDIERVEGSL